VRKWNARRRRDHRFLKQRNDKKRGYRGEGHRRLWGEGALTWDPQGEWSTSAVLARR
jgi:hypothetical protein